MITLLSKLFIKDRLNYKEPSVRGAYGTLTGAFGIFLNLLLFAGKLIAGGIARSVAVSADAFNNLSDAGSSIITLLGFRMAGAKPDTEHPFGHGRFEYIAGLLVSAAIMLMGFELLKTSIGRIIKPEATEFSYLALAILIVSVLVKLYMWFYNRSIGQKIGSAALLATAKDSLSDSVSTLVVLISMLISRFTSLRIDGWAGALVSLFVLYSGFGSAKDTIAPLLGTPPEKELVDRIDSIVTSFDRISGIHDLVIHDYGPGRRMISLHAEVPMEPGDDVFDVHDIIDNAERALQTELGCDATIHLDPVAANDENTERLKQKMTNALEAIDPALRLHDFRVVPGPTHTNMIFDVVLPYDSALSPEELRARIGEAAEKFEGGQYYAVVTVDRPYA